MRKKEEWLETDTVQARGLRGVTVKKENIAQGTDEADDLPTIWLYIVIG